MCRNERWLFPVALWLVLILHNVAVHAQQLTIQNEDGKQTILSRTDLEALPHAKIQASDHDVSASFEGVTLKNVLESAGLRFGESIKK